MKDARRSGFAAVGIVVILSTLSMITSLDGKAELFSTGNRPIQSGGTITYNSTAQRLHHVEGDRILDENGVEVIWRGAGGSYLFHAGERYQEAWQLHLPEIQAMGLNTIRLAFAFADSGPNPDYGVPSADILDFGKMDWVVEFLDQHGIKVILDLHNFCDMFGDFGSLKLVEDWVALAEHYAGDPRIVAYELFNEPNPDTWDPSVTSRMDVIGAYSDLTDAVRFVDPGHIVIWQSLGYLACASDVDRFAEVLQPYSKPNLVFTVHYWRHKESSFNNYTVEEASYLNLDYLVMARSKMNVPFWLGEFGSYSPFNFSNPEYQWTEQALFRCEEQVLGWNLWMERTSIDSPWNKYLSLYPLKIFNDNLVRRPWIMPFPILRQYVLDQNHVDELTYEKASMFHNYDWIVLAPGIHVLVEVEHKLPDGTFETTSRQDITVTEQLGITNVEETPDHPGDWNTHIYLVKA